MGLDMADESIIPGHKTMIYGLAGAGKSTLASKLSKPLFLDFEGGLNYLKVKKTKVYDKYEKFCQDLVFLQKYAEAGKRPCDTLVIDSADWMVRKCIEHAAGILNTPEGLKQTLNKSNGGYGNGKLVLENEIKTRLMGLLSKMSELGYNICFIAHADKKNVMNVDGYEEEQITPKIEETTMKTFVEWCDNVFYLKKDDSGKRTLLLESNNIAIAKNRIGRTGEINVDEIDINNLVSANNEEQ